jgi:hypothetical protein
MSVRLEKLLHTRGSKTLGELHGCDPRELSKTKNWGRKSIFELNQILRRAEAGEFTSVPLTFAYDPLSTLIRLISVGIGKVSERDRAIVRERLFGDEGESTTLDQVGKRFGISHERVRQIVRNAFKKIRRSGGPVFARALEAVANQRNEAVTPINAQLVAARLRLMPEASEWPAQFYVYAVDIFTESGHFSMGKSRAIVRGLNERSF